jgi:PKD repeat protein
MWSASRAGAVLVLSLSAAPLSAAGWSTAEPSGGVSGHSAVALYDGTVLIAGGDTGDPTNRVRIFNPATGLWRDAAPLAQARQQAAAVMLRSGRVLVTGGLSLSDELASVEIYDPASGQWSAGPSMAEARRLHTATLLDDGRVLVAAGIGSDGWLASAEIYDPASNTWSATGPLAVRRYDHSATRLRDGRVLIAAGTNQSLAGGALAPAEIYDPASGTWTSGGSLTYRRQRHTATLLNDGRVLVAGGLFYAPGSPNASYPAACEIFDPNTNTWTLGPSLLQPRSAHSATVLPDGRVLVAAGMTWNWETTAAELYSPTSNSWSSTASLLNVRAQHTATLLPNGRVLVVGGWRAYFGQVSSVEVFDIAAPSTAFPGSMSVERQEFSATVLPSGKVLAVGGSSADVFDPGTRLWSVAAAPGVARSRHTATLLAGGQVLVAGGSDGSAATATAQLYDPLGNTWTAAGTMSAAREEHTATLLPDGRVFVTGGANAGGTLAGAEVYDADGGWSDAASLAEPRRRHTATLLLTGKVLVTGGHSGAGVLATSALFDPETGLWAPTVNNMASGRYGHTATLLPDGQVMVAGGMGASAVLQTVEVFNPATGRWTTAGPLTAPRWKHTATLLREGRVFLVGGAGATGALSSTELYDPLRTPANTRWQPGLNLSFARYGHTATMLTSGAVLFAGGFNGTAVSKTGLIYQPAGSQSAAPVLTSVNDPVLDGVFTLTGSGFLGRTPGSAGTSEVDSPADHPLVQIRRLDNGAVRWAPVDPQQGWSDTSFVSRAMAGLQTGHAMVTVYVNGQASTSRIVLARAANGLPAARPGGPYSGTVDSPITFDGTGSSDPDGDPLEYSWDFGDGTTGSGASPVHTYAAPGTFTVTLIVSDGSASSPPATTTATVGAATQTLSLEVGGMENGSGVVAYAAGATAGSCATSAGQPQSCSASFASGTEVTLTATASPDSKFLGWTGACAGTDPICQVTMSEALTVGATFLGPRTLLVQVLGADSGVGQVAVSPAPLSGPPTCEATGPNPVECTFLYPPDTTVEVTATPASDSRFDGWMGECIGTGPCSVTLGGSEGSPPKFVLAQFLGPRTLRVLVTGWEGGTGLVAVSPAPLSGPPTCEVASASSTECVFLYPPDTTVQLTAVAASDSKFLGFGGDCIGTGPCSVTLDGTGGAPPKFVAADFLGPRSLNVWVSGQDGGVGLVAVAPAPLSGPPTCEVTDSIPVQCTFLYPPDTTVHLTAVAASDSKFLGFGGDCMGTGPCAITLDGDAWYPPKFVAADFLGPRQLLVTITAMDGAVAQVSVSPAPLSGPPTCEAVSGQEICTFLFPPDTTVHLTAVAASDSKFLGFASECMGLGPCVVVLDQGAGWPPKLVGADFLGPRALRVMANVWEGGTGQVTVSPAPLSGPPSCDVPGPGPADCTFLFPPDTTVHLTAVAASDSKFLGWSGHDCLGTGPCAITLDQPGGSPPRFVATEFLGPRTLRVEIESVAGGAGQVTVSPEPLGGTPPVCALAGPGPVECTFLYPPDTVVSIAATPAPGSTLTGWQGCEGMGSCQVTLTYPLWIQATFEVPNRPPTASPAAPSTGIRHQAVHFNGSASSDPDGDPLTYAWDFGDGTTGTGAMPSHVYTSLGPFTVTLVVSDGTASSPPATVEISIVNVAPSVQLTSPAHLTVFHAPASVAVAASASDPDGSVAGVQFFANGQLIGEDATAPYAISWDGVPAGGYLLIAAVTDDSGETAIDPVFVIVNAPPTANLMSPIPDSVFQGPAPITLEAAAADVDGSVVQVAFYQGDTLLGVDDTVPYTFQWSNVPVGDYVLTVRVTDDRGATTISTPTPIHVVPAIFPAVADAYVRDGEFQYTNFGFAPGLEVRLGPAGPGGTRWTYLKFSTTGLTSVRSAKLRLYGNLTSTTSANVRTRVYPASNTAWSEGTIRWTNRPSTGSTPLASVTLVNNSTAPRWYEWDVTAYLQQEKAAGRHIVTLVLRNDVSTNPTATFRSRQTNFNEWPQLWISP